MAGVSDRLTGEERTAGFPVLTVLALMAGIFAVGSEELVVSPLLVDMADSFDTSVAVMALSVTTTASVRRSEPCSTPRSGTGCRGASVWRSG